MKQASRKHKAGTANGRSTTNYSIREFVDRIRAKKASARAIEGAVRQIYADAKATGLDKTVLGSVVTYIEKRERDPAAFAQRSATFDRYLEEHDGTPVATHAHAPEVASASVATAPETVAGDAEGGPKPKLHDSLISSKLERLPDCLHPDMCAGTWRALCFGCEKACKARDADTVPPSENNNLPGNVE